MTQENGSAVHLILSILGLSAGLIVTACGGGGGGAEPTSVTPTPASSTTINGIIVAPHPGALANQTLLGVDTNANGVRDEIERDLATYAASKLEFDSAMKAAAEAQSWLTKSQNTEVQAQGLVKMEIGYALCLRGKLTTARAKDITTLIEVETFNTKLRRAQRQTILEQGGTFEVSDVGAASC